MASHKKSLPCILGGAVLITFLLGPTFYCVHSDEPAGRNLTSGEQAMAHAIGGYGVKIERIRIECKNIGDDWGRTFGSKIDINPTLCSEDFSKASKDQFGLLAHELEHVVDFQNGSPAPKCKATNDVVNTYTYPLDANPPYITFDALCHEQRAAAIEDYFRRFLHPAANSRWVPDQWWSDYPRQQLVEKHYPSTYIARTAFDPSRFGQ